MTKMGFESNKRIIKVLGNRPITATVGGKTYHFRSEGEFMYAQYLEFLYQSGEIIGWSYEPPPFFFKDVKFGPVQYKLDFCIGPKKGMAYYVEFKRGYLDGSAVTKLRRMADQYPDVIIELAMMGIPKKTNNRMRTACKYTRGHRIVDASAIFKQMGKLIISAKDYRMGKELQEKTNDKENQK